MKAYQCDRCFKYYTDNKDVPIPGKASSEILSGIELVTGHQTPSKVVKSYDLCDDCAKELVNWITYQKGFGEK